MNKYIQKLKNGIIKSIRSCNIYFTEKSKELSRNSQIMVGNHSGYLYNKFIYFLNKYKDALIDYKKGNLLLIEESIGYKPNDLCPEIDYFATSCVDSFFSWTEHVFIHFSILNSNVTKKEELFELCREEWKNKYNKSFSNEFKLRNKDIYNLVLEIKVNVRNFPTHCSVGYKNEIFSYNSEIGLIPLSFCTKGPNQFSFNTGLSTEDNYSKIIATIEEFSKRLICDNVMHYHIDRGLVTYLPFSNDGTYKNLSKSKDLLHKYVDKKVYKQDCLINCDD